MTNLSKFEPIPNARHRIEVIDGVEWVVVRAARNWFLLPFLAFWLVGWSAGGIAAMTAFTNGQDRGFLGVWLIGWAFGWAFAATAVAWQIAGRTFLGVRDGGLAHRWSMPLLSKEKAYEVSQVRNLRTASNPWSMFFSGFGRSPYPPFFPMTGGTIAFDYGARTIRVLPEIDEAEGASVIEWLKRRLPVSTKG